MSRKSLYLIALPCAIVLAIVLTVVLADRHVTTAVPLLQSAVARLIVGFAIASLCGMLVRKLRWLS